MNNTPEKTLETLGDIGLIPVVKVDRAEDAVPLGRALMEGGLPCAEITFRTAAAEEAIRRIASALPQIVVGAGTILSVDQAEKAVLAGAQFIVSAGFDPKVVDWCLAKGVSVTQAR
jgi:2-dehydro-3-deoxyphosphogluconate aldolase/(4S)-4-hydroxy-2-oxoglutarate aldolase